MLKNENEEWIRGEQQIQGMIAQYYQHLYNSVGFRDWQPIIQNIPTLVDEQMNITLTAPLTEEEITAAMLQLGALKAPGPDGFHGIFYKDNWPAISQGVIQEIQAFFNSGKLDPLHYCRQCALHSDEESSPGRHNYWDKVEQPLPYLIAPPLC